jgi:hypothetical protein
VRALQVVVIIIHRHYDGIITAFIDDPSLTNASDENKLTDARNKTKLSRVVNAWIELQAACNEFVDSSKAPTSTIQGDAVLVVLQVY